MSVAMNAPTDPNDPLTYYWSRQVEDVATVVNTAITPGEAERHTILSLLVMALVSDAFNGNKHGDTGSYPWRSGQFNNGRYVGGNYFGHNIGCVAVDARGALIDFEFNHNEIFNSSVEHAEARLVRRIFNLNQNYDHWQTIDPKQLQDVPYTTTLSGVTIYTSLESCAQCSGIMTLGNVKSVVYLQTDPGQYRIGNILYNLSNPISISHPGTAAPKGSSATQPATKYGAPEPINAEIFDFKYKADLDAAYHQYVQTVTANSKTQFFYQPSGGGATDASTSITSFLCCDPAKAIFDRAANELDVMSLKCPDYPPAIPGTANGPLSNEESLRQARLFRNYVARVGRRGTPHK